MPGPDFFDAGMGAIALMQELLGKLIDKGILSEAEAMAIVDDSINKLSAGAGDYPKVADTLRALFKRP